TGQASTTGFPSTSGTYDSTHNGGNDMFISLFSSNLSATPTAQFTATTSSSSEDNATANFQVFLDGPAASLSASVDYAVTGGTATGSGTDYTLASGTLTIVAGQTVGYITISVTDDTAIESNETVVVTLSNPVNAFLGTNTTHTFTIVEDDHTSSGTADTNPPPYATPVPMPPISHSSSIRLIRDGATFYIIQDGQKFGVTNPGVLCSYGLEFKDAVLASSAENSLPKTSNLPPGAGALVKASGNPTVYLITGNKRLPFISAKVFKDLGFNFASVLEITSPELLSLTLGTAISDSLSPHSAGTYINQDGTIYLINFDGTKS